MSDTGKMIQEMRIRVGFTQKTLAEALHVTDKAISKWERGICLPDTSLLPKLALLLDTDIDILISNSIDESEWVGLIAVDHCDLSQTIYDKPLAYYLLSHYLLLGIRNVHFVTDEKNQEHLNDGRYRSFGFNFFFELPKEKNVIMINHPWFIFGSDLTQQFQGAMLSNRVIGLKPENQDAVVYCVPKTKIGLLTDMKALNRRAGIRTLGRGMVVFDMNNSDDILDVSTFVKTYQRNSDFQ